MGFTAKLATRTQRMGVNAIREILKVVSKPGMISLAGGIPSPESFPMQRIQHMMEKVLDQYGASALQYGATEGFGPLREALVDHLAERRLAANAREILIASGSQGVLDALGKVLISKGDQVAVESPTYLGALQAFGPYEPQYVGLAADDDGLIPDALEIALRSHAVKFVYLVPNFQNPTGRTLPLDRRKSVARLIRQYDTLLVEDDPYGDLRYTGEHLPTIKSMAPGHVLYIGTLSKVFAPGLRVGFCLPPKSLKKWLVMVKQGVDLHTNTLSQALAAEYISGGHLKNHLPKILQLYKPRQRAMLDALKRYFPTSYGWSRPEGGMFIWVQGPEQTDMVEIYKRAVKRRVAFVPGTYFYAEKGLGMETMRLNFTMCDETVLDHAIKTLAEVVGTPAYKLSQKKSKHP